VAPNENARAASAELASDWARLREAVRLAANIAGAGVRVTVHVASPGGNTFELRACSEHGSREKPHGNHAMSDPAARRAVSTAARVIVSGERTMRVLTPVVDGSGEVVGLVDLRHDDPHAGSAERSDGSDATAPRPTGIPSAEQWSHVSELLGHLVLAARHAEAADRANRALRARATVDDRLSAVARSGGGLSAIVRECAALTGRQVVLFNRERRRLVSADVSGSAGIDWSGISEILDAATVEGGEESAPVIVPAAAGGPTRRTVVAPVSLDGEVFGWLVIDEEADRPHPTVAYAAQRAASLLAAEIVVQRRVARTAWNAKSALARHLVKSGGAGLDLAASAEYLGIDIEARRVLAYVLDPGGHEADQGADESLARAVQQTLGVDVLATRGSEGLLLLVEAPRERGGTPMVHTVKAAIRDALAAYGLGGAIVGVSSVCEPGTVRRGYREAREVAYCIDRFAGPATCRVLAVDDLGPARFLLANTERGALGRYVTDVLGPLLGSGPGRRDLLLTLQCYVDTGRSVRASAAQLGVHENTIRLRLSRVAAATGLDVAGDPNDQLAVQTALIVLRLQGQPGLPAVGAPTRHHERDSA
jgi:sugar diacid utilization regulator